MRRTSTLYRMARLSADVDAVASGKPKRVVHRVGSHVKGRVLARLGFWRFLWGRWP